MTILWNYGLTLEVVQRRLAVGAAIDGAMRVARHDPDELGPPLLLGLCPNRPNEPSLLKCRYTFSEQ